MKECLKSMGIKREMLNLRLSLIPATSREILSCEWELDKKKVTFNKLQYDKAVEDLKKTRYLVVGYQSREKAIFQKGYKNFELAVICGNFYRSLFDPMGKPCGKTAEEFYDVLLKGFNNLSENHKNAIWLRYGFEDGKFYTLDEVAKIYGISKSTLHYRETQAICILRQYISRLLRK